MSPRLVLQLLWLVGVVLTSVSAHAVNPRRQAQTETRLATSAGIAIDVITINNNWIGCDPMGGKLYVSLGSSTPNGNSILRVDPSTMVATTPLFVGSEPGIGTISNDGQFLYVFLNGSAQVRRVHLPTFTAGIQFPLGSDYSGSWRAEDMEVVPGQSNLLVVTMFRPGYVPRSAGTAIYDNGVRRPAMVGSLNRHLCHPNGVKLYGIFNDANYIRPGTINHALGANGITNLRPNSYVLSDVDLDGALYNGLIYANNGTVYDPESDVLTGHFAGGSGIPVVDSDLRRVYFLTGRGSATELKVYDQDTYLQVGSSLLPGVDGEPTGLVSCPDGGFAFRTATQVFVIHTSYRRRKPQSPTDLSSTIQSGNTVSLHWTDNSDSEDGFQIERSIEGEAFSEIATVAANKTTYSDGGLATSTQYTYRIRAFNLIGISGYSNSTTAKTFPAPPTAPANLNATAVSYNQVSLSWQDTSNAEDSFEIERKTGNGDFTPISALGPNRSNYLDADVSEQTTYAYRIRSANLGGSSGYSNEAAVTTPAAPTATPSNLTAGAVSSSEIRLSWKDNSTNESLFKVERKTGSGAFAQIGTAAARAGTGSSITYSDTVGLAPDVTYTFQVRATGPLGDSGYSGQASTTTAPAPPPSPSGLIATISSPTAITLTWTDNSANETGFKVERKVDSGAFTFIGQVPADSTSFPDPGLAGDSLYIYRIRATNPAGDSAYSSTASTVTAPTAPILLSATSFGAGQIKLTWVDNSKTETGFKIERKIGGSFETLTTVSTGVGFLLDADLVPHSFYHYRVRATNAGGESAPSTEGSALTLPAAPTALTVSPITAAQLELRWTDNNPSPPAVKVERSTDGGINFVSAGTSAAGTTTFRDNGLNAASTYHYRMRATNTAGDSGYTATVSGTTLPASPAAPSSLVALVQNSGTVLLTWQDNSVNETGFEIARLSTAVGGYQLISRTEVNAVSFTDFGVSGSTTYTYRIRAVNSGGGSAYTAAVNVTTPANLPIPPENLSATAFSSTQIQLTWADLTNIETGFRVERKLAGGTYAVVTTTGANAVQYLDSGLTEGNAYTYRIIATSKPGDSPASAEVTATTLLGAPTGLVATAAANRINLAWQDGSTHESDFQIERKVPGGSFAALATVGANVTAYADTAVTANTTYTYRVKAMGSAGGSSYSNESTAAPLNVTPLAKLVVAPTKVSFGTVRVGANKLKTVKLTNKGKEPLSATVGLVGAPFAVVSGGGSVTLVPKQSVTVTLRYAPTAAGTATAALRITSTVPATPQVDVALSGKGK